MRRSKVFPRDGKRRPKKETTPTPESPNNKEDERKEFIDALRQFRKEIEREARRYRFGKYSLSEEEKDALDIRNSKKAGQSSSSSSKEEEEKEG